MASTLKALMLAFTFACLAHTAAAASDPMSERMLGKADAPVRIDEFASLTCSHCAALSNDVLPAIEEKYIKTGKAKLVFHDFPLDGVSLKAAAIARCMPPEQYFPFLATLFKMQMSWAFGGGDIEAKLIQLAQLGGLPADKAKACASDTKLLDAIIAERTEATEKHQINATPTIIINNGAETITGETSIAGFSAAIERFLPARK